MKGMRFMEKLYSKGEEIFNGVTHIVGGGIGIIFLIIGTIIASIKGDSLDILALVIYGVSMIILYSMSSIYHMLNLNKGKAVFQILDHCTIYLLICGTYTPYILVSLRNLTGYIILAIVYGVSILGIVLNATMMKKLPVKIFSYISYLGIGWCVVFIIFDLIEAISLSSFIFLLLGGLAYTSGMIFYALGRKKKWFHSIWHIFVLIGSILQFVSIILLFY